MRIFLISGTVLGWFALVAQLYLIILGRVASVEETLVRYFSFFTVLTNILVALCFTFMLFRPLSKWGMFFSRSTVSIAIAIYITVVGLVYNIVLRPLWNPEGLQMIVDELLHSVIPVLYVVYWFVYLRKDHLQWKDIVYWLLYPLLYLIFILVRGSFSGFYPYPFVDVGKLGYHDVMINCGFVCITFLFFSVLFTGVAKIRNKTST